MRFALDKRTNNLVLADAMVRYSQDYRCLGCNQDVCLKKGPVNAAHFAHIGDVCSLGERSEEHGNIQVELYLEFSKLVTSDPARYVVRVEYKIGNRRADIIFIDTLKDLKLVIEIQRSRIEIEEIVDRTKCFSEHGFTTLWLLDVDYMKRLPAWVFGAADVHAGTVFVYQKQSPLKFRPIYMIEYNKYFISKRSISLSKLTEGKSRHGFNVLRLAAHDAFHHPDKKVVRGQFRYWGRWNSRQHVVAPVVRYEEQRKVRGYFRIFSPDRSSTITKRFVVYQIPAEDLNLLRKTALDLAQCFEIYPYNSEDIFEFLDYAKASLPSDFMIAYPPYVLPTRRVPSGGQFYMALAFEGAKGESFVIVDSAKGHNMLGQGKIQIPINFSNEDDDPFMDRTTSNSARG